MSQLINGITQGMREGPLVFVAPIVAVWRLFNDTANDLIGRVAIE